MANTKDLEAAQAEPEKEVPPQRANERQEDTQEYARKVAQGSFDWYRSHAIRSRQLYKGSEVAVILASAAIPVFVAVSPATTWIPALLGGAVAATTGLRPVFHWQDNYLRFSEAREAVERERRLYRLEADPYADPLTRDQLLVKAVSAIEQSEMGGWLKVATKQPGSE